MRKINFQEKLSKFSEHWTPKVIAEMNDYQFKLVKIEGEFVWHDHKEEDELFYVIKGELIMELKDPDERSVTIRPGEFIVVPRKVMHRPIAQEEVHVMLFEPASTINTGDLDHDLTKKDLPRI